MTHLRKTVLSLALLAAMTASAQDNFSAKANALRQQYQTEAAKTRAAGEASDTMASFVVICKSDASPVVVGERLGSLGSTLIRK